MRGRRHTRGRREWDELARRTRAVLTPFMKGLVKGPELAGGDLQGAWAGVAFDASGCRSIRVRVEEKRGEVWIGRTKYEAPLEETAGWWRLRAKTVPGWPAKFVALRRFENRALGLVRTERGNAVVCLAQQQSDVAVHIPASAREMYGFLLVPWAYLVPLILGATYYYPWAGLLIPLVPAVSFLFLRFRNPEDLAREWTEAWEEEGVAQFAAETRASSA